MSFFVRFILWNRSVIEKAFCGIQFLSEQSDSFITVICASYLFCDFYHLEIKKGKKQLVNLLNKWMNLTNIQPF